MFEHTRHLGVLVVALLVVLGTAAGGAAGLGVSQPAPADDSSLVGPPGDGNGTATLEVRNVTAPDTVSADRPLSVEATLENTGDARAKGDVEYRIDGNTVDSRQVMLQPNASRTVRFTIQPRKLAPGNYTHGVYTPDDNATTSINVTESDRTTGPGEDLPADAADWTETSPLGPDQTEPNNLAGKLRVESSVVENTTVNLTRNTATDYTLAINVTGNATNVTFYLQKQAVSASQNISNVTAYLDGEQFNFTVADTHGQWIVFVVDHFSTREVTFSSQAGPPDRGNGTAEFAVKNLSAPENATTKRPIKITATIDNQGNASAKETIEYRVDNDTVDSRPVRLSPDQNRTVTFTLRTRDLGPGTYSHGVYTPDDNATATITVAESNRTGGPGGDLPDEAANWTETSALGPDQTEPNSLAGKLRVESSVVENTTVDLERNTSMNYTLAINVTENATNVTFYLQKQAVAASQNVSNVSAYLDGEQFNYTVADTHGQWIVFVVDHFSTREVTFSSADTIPDQDFDGDGLYEDVNDDGDFDILDVQALFARFESDAVQNNVGQFDFNGDGEVNIVDVQALFVELQSTS